MNKDLDVTLISPFLAVELVGVYKMAKNVVLLAWRAVDPALMALMPEINRLAAIGLFGDAFGLIKRSTIWLAVVAASVGIVSYLFINFASTLIFGSAFAALPDLYPSMYLGIFLSAPLIWCHPLSVALERPEIGVIGSLVGAVSGIVLISWLVPILGVRGAGVGWSLSFFVHFAIVSFWTIRLLRLRLA
jgi:O-antigen/teichoic acid export membrane protein